MQNIETHIQNTATCTQNTTGPYRVPINSLHRSS
jgi:hypothetical protein